MITLSNGQNLPSQKLRADEMREGKVSSMRFSERLNEWMELADCTAKELSEACGLSAATLSRFRSGERTPDQEGLKLLLQGLCTIAACKGKQLSPDSLYAQCTDCMDLQRSDPEALRTKINRLLTVLHISSAELAKAISYDPSFLSRIRSGQRAPADPKRFAADVARFVVRRFDGESGRSAVAHMLCVPFGSLSGEAEYFRAVADWLMGSAAAEDTESSSVSAFLNAMNSFDLNEYIRAIHFDELCVPNVPFLLQTARTYHGLEEMKKGELDFFKATVLSKSTEPVFLYSDMPMEDMAADLDFSKKYMLGLALLLKKGLHLNIIHSLNRPFQEMMLGLESHIPLYMTGQISPYYLQSAPNTVFCHFLKVSGSAALSGECIAGCHEDGMYRLSRGKRDLAYYRKRADDLLQKAKPLMDIYREMSQNELNAFLAADSETAGNRRNLLSAPPIYTATPEFLTTFLTVRSIPEAEQRKILSFAEQQRILFLRVLQDNHVRDELPLLTQAEFEETSVSLPVSGLFPEHDFLYSYKEYLEHLRLTENFEKCQPHYSLELVHFQPFSNLNILIHEGKWAMVSKNKAPCIHFVIRHPKLRRAIERFIPPIIECE